MEEMYTMTIGVHAFVVWALIGVTGLNIVQLLMAENIYQYANKTRVWMPIGATLIAAVLFTGTIMMAAKHLDFTVENIVMIVFGIVMIVLEVKRYKILKRTDPRKEDAMASYKRIALRILGAEMIWTAGITAWMVL